MKYISALLAILAIIGLGQAQPFSDIGESSLQDDIDDFIKLFSTEKVTEIVVSYLEDEEVVGFLNYVLTTTVVKDTLIAIEAIPEFINLLNYLHNEKVDIYYLINEANKFFGIDPLVPPSSHSYSANINRTGGVKGLITDILAAVSIDEIIHLYATKLQTSTPFVNLIDQIKSKNCQVLVNKMYKEDSYKILVDKVKSYGVNTQIGADLMYILFGITVPNGNSVYQERSWK